MSGSASRLATGRADQITAASCASPVVPPDRQSCGTEESRVSPDRTDAGFRFGSTGGPQYRRCHAECSRPTGCGETAFAQGTTSVSPGLPSYSRDRSPAVAGKARAGLRAEEWDVDDGFPPSRRVKRVVEILSEPHSPWRHRDASGWTRTADVPLAAGRRAEKFICLRWRRPSRRSGSWLGAPTCLSTCLAPRLRVCFGRPCALACGAMVQSSRAHGPFPLSARLTSPADSSRRWCWSLRGWFRPHRHQSVPARRPTALSRRPSNPFASDTLGHRTASRSCMLGSSHYCASANSCQVAWGRACAFPSRTTEQ